MSPTWRSPLKLGVTVSVELGRLSRWLDPGEGEGMGVVIDMGRLVGAATRTRNWLDNELNKLKALLDELLKALSSNGWSQWRCWRGRDPRVGYANGQLRLGGDLKPCLAAVQYVNALSWPHIT